LPELRDFIPRHLYRTTTPPGQERKCVSTVVSDLFAGRLLLASVGAPALPRSRLGNRSSAPGRGRASRCAPSAKPAKRASAAVQVLLRMPAASARQKDQRKDSFEIREKIVLRDDVAQMCPHRRFWSFCRPPALASVGAPPALPRRPASRGAHVPR